MPFEIGSWLGNHEILSALGKGGMGEVWRARDSKLGREVAVKTLPAEFARDGERLARFEREARVLASLNHPNIASIYGIEEFSGTRFLVLELVEGETLAEVLKSGPLAAEDAVKLALQIATAIEAAHEKGVVHRDLKPANIKITPDGKVKVLDFGLAKALQADEQDISNSPTLSMAATARGIILGTAAYMSPEQARGITVDSRSDVWAFGCVLYEMLSGRQTFRGETVSDILASVLAREPDFTPFKTQLHPRLQEIVQRCLEKDPKRRWQTIADVRIELDRLLASGVTPPETSAVAPAQPWKLVPWVAAALLLGAAAAWVLKPAPPSEPKPIVRFDYEVPQNRALRNIGRAILALSPDGRHFVYNSVGGLFLRSMDSLTARIIPGTEESLLSPFFSPDGEWVGYYSPTGPSLRKIPIAGGAPVTIGPVAALPFGITWNKDNTILFGQAELGILRVSADGGTPEVVIKTKEGEVAYGPSLLPDGKTVLYSLTRTNGVTRWDQAEIVAQEVGSATPKVLLRGASDARYIPTGHLLYAIGTVVFAVALDLDTLSLKGGAVPLVQGVQRAAQPTTNTAAANFALSDNGTLVYQNSLSAGEVPKTTLGIADRNGSVRRLDLSPGVYRNPRVSPDGRSVAVETISETGQSIIWVYGLSGTTAIRRLTQEGSNTRPLWTRDSKRIVYGSDRDKTHGLYWQLADGSGLPERLTTAAEGLLHFPESWSPDGKVLSFAAAGRTLGQDSWALWTLAMDAADKKPTLFYDVPGANEFGSAFSPDGKWISYASNNANQADGRFGIYAQPYPPTGAKYEISRNGGAWPLWHPLGGELFYRLNVGEINAARIKAVTITTSPVPVFTSDKELPIQGFVLATNYRDYDVMPNGREFVMVFPVTPIAPTAPPSPSFQIVLNWLEDLKARVPVK
jgi:serine/threonine protein kinase/Tol biopolymer transport system component